MLEAREYQTRIVKAALTHLSGNAKTASVLIESPTGSGKSVMGLMICQALQKKHGYTIGWSAMRRNLLTQVARENIEKSFNVKMVFISMFDKNPPKVDVLVVDEAQHDSTSSMTFVHTRIKPKIVVGLTATPYRSDRLGLCFDKIIKDCGIHQLIYDGFLSKYHHYTIDAFTPESVAQVYLSDPEKWGKSVVFFHKIQQCRKIKALLDKAGVRTELVTATSDKEEQLAAFENGDVDVLINMMILVEGFDSPSLQTVFVRPSTKGCTVQMAGRVFRKYPGLAYKQIVQCKATKYSFLRHAKPTEQYSQENGVWRSLTPNAKIDQIAAASVKAIAAAVVEFNPASLTGFRKKMSFNDFD